MQEVNVGPIPGYEHHLSEISLNIDLHSCSPYLGRWFLFLVLDLVHPRPSLEYQPKVAIGISRQQSLETFLLPFVHTNPNPFTCGGLPRDVTARLYRIEFHGPSRSRKQNGPDIEL